MIPFVGVHTGKVEAVSLDAIDLGDETFKFRVSLRVASLAKSIKAEGQQIPVLLRRLEGSGQLQVISGFRRITAIKSLRWPTVNAIVRSDLDDDATACRVSILENEHRQTYNDVDRAHAILAYRKMGTSADEIEELFRVGARQRQRLEKLTTFPLCRRSSKPARIR